MIHASFFKALLVGIVINKNEFFKQYSQLTQIYEPMNYLYNGDNLLFIWKIKKNLAHKGFHLYGDIVLKKNLALLGLVYK